MTPVARAASVGVYRFWRDMGYVAGGLLAGVLVDAIEFSGAIAIVAVLTLASGLWVAVDLQSGPHREPRQAPRRSGGDREGAGSGRLYARHVGRYGPVAPRSCVSPMLTPTCERSTLAAVGALTEVLASAVGPVRVARSTHRRSTLARAAAVPGVDVRIGQAETLPFDDGVFDAVLSQPSVRR